MSNPNKLIRQSKSEILFEQAERNLARGNPRGALKEAKQCYREEASERNHQLLERATLARVQELVRFGLRSEAGVNLKNLIEFGVTDETVLRWLPELQVALGLFSAAQPSAKQGAPAAAAPALDARMLLAVADQAVLRPERAPQSMPDVLQGAINIRGALEAISAADDARGLELLKDVPRNSPFADWKLFARGLAAYYRHDAADMRANWDRLDAARAAHRIAATLRKVDTWSAAPAGMGETPPEIRALERSLLGDPLLSDFETLRSQLRTEQFKQGVRGMRQIRRPLRELSPSLLDRTVRLLTDELTRRGMRFELDDLTRLVDPWTFDPQWNRARAMVRDHPDNPDLANAELYWRAYVNDLAELPAIPVGDRPLAQALVWLECGRQYLLQARHSDPPRGFMSGRPRNRQSDLTERAVACINRGLELQPKLLAAYEELATLHKAAGKDQLAADVYLRLLIQFPEHLDALLFVTNHLLAADQPREALAFAERAQRLKPLDKALSVLIWRARIAAARHLAKAKKYDLARAELDAADKLQPVAQVNFMTLIRRGVLELKAGNRTQGQTLLEQAKQSLPEPAPALLGMSIEAIRFGLPPALRTQFESDWIKASSKKCGSRTASELCWLINGLLEVHLKYAHQKEHVELVHRYVERCSRVKWEEPGHLFHVLRFLTHEDDMSLVRKYAEKGTKLFPRLGYFWLMAAQATLVDEGTFPNPQRVKKMLEKAIEAAKTSHDPVDATVVSEAQKSLVHLNELLEIERMRSPFGFPFFGGSPFFDDEDDDEDDYFEDDEYEPEESPFFQPPLPFGFPFTFDDGPPPKPKKPKKTRKK